MLNQQITELKKTITQKENLTLIKKIIKQFYHEHSIEECGYYLNNIGHHLILKFNRLQFYYVNMFYVIS